MDQTEKKIFDLRPLVPADAEELFALTIKNKNHLRTFLNWMKDDYKMEDTVKFLTESLQKEKDDKMLVRAIIRENKIIGLVDLHGINQDRNGEIGYWISQDEQGKGIVTQATREIIEEGFHRLDLNRIALRCAVGNTKSCAIPKRLGFKQEGILRQTVLLPQGFSDMELWSLLKNEWK